MRNEALEQFEHAGCTIKIYPDEMAESPREWDQLGTICCWHRRYNLGDEQPKVRPDEYLRKLADRIAGGPYAPDVVTDEWCSKILHEQTARLPVYMYDHSGLCLSTTPFSCPWDSGQLGFIYCTLQDARDRWELPKTAGWDHELDDYANPGAKISLKALAERVLNDELEEYDQFIQGNVYCYTITDEDGEDVGSCGGYLGDSGYCKGQPWQYMLDEAKGTAEFHRDQKNKLAAETAVAEAVP